MQVKNLKSVVWQEGKYYVAECLNNHVSSFGDTKKQAIENLEEALELYFENEKEVIFSKVENPELVHVAI